MAIAHARCLTHADRSRLLAASSICARPDEHPPAPSRSDAAYANPSRVHASSAADLGETPLPPSGADLGESPPHPSLPIACLRACVQQTRVQPAPAPASHVGAARSSPRLTRRCSPLQPSPNPWVRPTLGSGPPTPSYHNIHLVELSPHPWLRPAPARPTLFGCRPPHPTSHSLFPWQQPIAADICMRACLCVVRARVLAHVHLSVCERPRELASRVS